MTYIGELISIGVVFSLVLFGVTPASAQQPQRFHKQLPPGNYSGIAPLGNDRYALVSDKAEEDGFYVFRIQIDTLQGRITEVENEGLRSSGLPNRDMEGICYRPSTNTVFISGEQDNEVFEYTLDGQRTGQRLQMPEIFKTASHNYGLESLTYDQRRHLFFTTTEHLLSRLNTWAAWSAAIRVFLLRPPSKKEIHSKWVMPSVRQAVRLLPKATSPITCTFRSGRTANILM